MVFGKFPRYLFFNAQVTEGQRVDSGAESERLAMVQQAVCHLYGKRGIRFFPARADQQLGPDEFLIPGFGYCSHNQWSTTHYIVVLGDAPWALTDKELELSRNLQTFYRKASMKTIGAGSGSKVQSTERPTVIPEGARKTFQEERPRGQTTQNESAASSGAAHGSEQGPRGRGAAASAPANSSRPDPSRPHRDREIYFPLAFEEWLVAENIRNS